MEIQTAVYISDLQPVFHYKMKAMMQTFTYCEKLLVEFYFIPVTVFYIFAFISFIVAAPIKLVMLVHSLLHAENFYILLYEIKYKLFTPNCYIVVLFSYILLFFISTTSLLCLPFILSTMLYPKTVGIDKTSLFFIIL